MCYLYPFSFCHRSFIATHIPSPHPLDSSVKLKIPLQHKPTTALLKYTASALGPKGTDAEPKIQQPAMQQTQYITSYRSTSVKLTDFRKPSIFSRAVRKPSLKETFELEKKLDNKSGFRLCCHNNQLWLPTTSGNSIDVYSMSGTLQRSITSDQLQRPRSIHPLDDQNMVLADANGLFLIDSQGKVTRKIMAGDMQDVHADGNTVVALETITLDLHGKVHILNKDKSLNVEKSFLLEKNPAQSIMIVSGNIYVSFTAEEKRYNDFICKYDRNGNKLAQYGKHGSGGPGELYGPVICASDPEGSLLIADVFNKRLQMLDFNGQWSVMMNLYTDIKAVLDAVFDGQQHMYVLYCDAQSQRKIFKYQI